MLTSCVKRLYPCLSLLLILVSSLSSRATVRSWHQQVDGVHFVLDIGVMKVRICRPDLVEVQYTTLADLPGYPSLVVNNTWAAGSSYTVTETASAVVILTKRLRITVDKATNAITYADLNGKTILAEDKSDNKTMHRSIVAGIPTYSCGTGFRSPSDEGLFGLGCHPLDSLSIDYKGRDQDLAIRYLTGAIPVLLSTRG